MTESFFVNGFRGTIDKDIIPVPVIAPQDGFEEDYFPTQGGTPPLFAVRFNLREVTAGKEGRMTRGWLQDIYEKAKNDFIDKGNSSTDCPSGAHLRSSSKIIEEALSTPKCDWCGEDCDFKYFCMKEIFKNERAEFESGAGCHKVAVSGF